MQIACDLSKSIMGDFLQVDYVKYMGKICNKQ